MRYPRHSLVLALFQGASIYPLALPAQRAAVFVGVRPAVAFIDNQRDATLQGTGFQVSAFIGRAFASDFAALLELGITTVTHRSTYPPTYPCAFPGCSGPSSLGEETAISFAPGFRWYTSAGARRAAFTLTPGAVWLVNRPAGTEGVLPKLGGRFDLGWTVHGGPSVGVSAGVEWWGSTGMLPRWVVPLGLTLGLR